MSILAKQGFCFFFTPGDLLSRGELIGVTIKSAYLALLPEKSRMLIGHSASLPNDPDLSTKQRFQAE